MLKDLFKKLGKSKKPKAQSLTPNDDALGLNPEPATSTTAIATSDADPMPTVLASTATVSVQATDVTVSVQLSPSYHLIIVIDHTAHQTIDVVPTSVNDLALVAHLEGNDNKSPSSPDVIRGANLASTESEQNPSVSRLCEVLWLLLMVCRLSILARVNFRMPAMFSLPAVLL